MEERALYNVKDMI